MEEDYCQKNKFIPRELKTCPEYGKPRISFGWCKDCETNSMKENFLYWTSENKEIDELIRYTQLNAPQTCDYLEWIPFEKFEMVKYIGTLDGRTKDGIGMIGLKKIHAEGKVFMDLLDENF
ncbi:21896_t:CDS:2 [Rhizophagus irregularis]|nr:21896_t:CDS:2 [Rhizophagus irregularis]